MEIKVYDAKKHETDLQSNEEVYQVVEPTEESADRGIYNTNESKSNGKHKK